MLGVLGPCDVIYGLCAARLLPSSASTPRRMHESNDMLKNSSRMNTKSTWRKAPVKPIVSFSLVRSIWPRKPSLTYYMAMPKSHQPKHRGVEISFSFFHLFNLPLSFLLAHVNTEEETVLESPRKLPSILVDL